MVPQRGSPVKGRRVNIWHDVVAHIEMVVFSIYVGRCLCMYMDSYSAAGSEIPFTAWTITRRPE